MSKKELITLETLPREMKTDVLFRKRIPRTIAKSSIRRIPAIDDFKLGDKKVNEVLELVGLSRMMRDKATPSINRFRNMNRYLGWQLKRARKELSKGNPKGFWLIARKTMRFSLSARVSAVYKVFPHWYYSLSIGFMNSILKKVQKIIIEDNYEVEFKRVYIEKANGKLRPLGVPAPEWRIVSYMWTCWLVEFLRDEVEKFNHAFLPGKGTLTAWRDIITKVLNKKNIYEFDLQSFFDNIYIDDLSESLRDKGMPDLDWIYLDGMNMCTPSNINDVREDEVLQKAWYNEVGGMLLWESGKMKGLPQGLSTSPILSIFTLKDWYKKLKRVNNNLLMYADDGLIYSNETLYEKNHLINLEKSRWIKRRGEWLVEEFKFLGLTYNVKTQMLRGDTRKGSTLEFDTARKGLFDLLRYLKNQDLKYDQNLKLLAESSVFGTIQSRLYDNTWDNRVHPEKEWKIHKNSLWQTLGYNHRTLLSGPLSIYFLASLTNTSMNKSRKLIRKILS